MINIWLDDLRPEPFGWVRFKSADPLIAFLTDNFRLVRAISLDHDLGEVKTGYDVLCWIEEKVHEGTGWFPDIRIHTDNAGARKKMQQGVDKINVYVFDS